MDDVTDIAAKEILDTMLGYLGFVAEVRRDEAAGEHALQVFTAEAALLIGRRGDRLDDIQYLVNTLLHSKLPGAPRVRVDVEHHRAMQEDKLLEGVRAVADRVRTTGRPAQLEPLNAYHRRLVHNAFVGDPDVETASPKVGGRLKRITLRCRRKKNWTG